MRNKKIVMFIAALALYFSSTAIDAVAAGAVSVGDVSVAGQKVSRSNTTLNKQSIENSTPGLAPIQLLNKLPGVNATSGGSLGLYEYATQIYIRGFDKSQIGQVLDGIPLGGGLTAGGAPANRFIDTENLMKINVSQGSADIASPSNSALGGTLTYTTIAPSNKQALKATQTLGSFNLDRSFVRYNTGLIGSNKAYLSLSNTILDKWRSKGRLSRQHAEFKDVYAFGDSALELKITYNDRTDHDYLDINKTAFKKFGRFYGLHTTWTGISNLDQNNYEGWTNGRTDYLYSIKLDSMLSNNIHFSVLPYYHYQKGWGRWNPPYILSINPLTGVATTPPLATRLAANKLSFRESTYRTSRYGVTASVDTQVGINALKAGLWVEDGIRRNGRNWYKTINSKISYMPDRSQLYYNQFEYRYKTSSLMAYLQDTLSFFDDSLSINLGVQSRRVKVDFNGLTNNQMTKTNLIMTSQRYFLPKAGITYKLGSGQLFASYSENFSALPDSIFTQSTFSTQLQPEKSRNIDVGYRYDNHSTSFDVSYYNIDYRDKLETLTVATGNRFFGNLTELSNVGGVRTQGFELSAGQQLGRYLNLYGTTTLNSSKYQQDIQALKIKGNQVIGQPKVMATLDVNYKNGAYSTDLVGKYVGKRYASRDNTESVPGYTIVDLHMGYSSKKKLGILNDITVSFNVNNLLDRSYLSTILGSNQGLNHGGGATYYVGTPRNISMMFSATL